MCRFWPWLNSSLDYALPQFLCNWAATSLDSGTAAMAAWLSSADGQRHQSRMIGMLRATHAGHAGLALCLGALAYAEDIVARHGNAPQSEQRRPRLDDFVRVLAGHSPKPPALWQAMASYLRALAVDPLVFDLLEGVADERSSDEVDPTAAHYLELRRTKDHDEAVAAMHHEDYPVTTTPDDSLTNDMSEDMSEAVVE